MNALIFLLKVEVASFTQYLLSVALLTFRSIWKVFPTTFFLHLIPLYSVQMRENVDWNNSEYRHSSRSGRFLFAMVQLLAAYIAQVRNFYKE